jgi:predicted DNA-binding transcriptional regulator AlpA
MSDTEPLLLDAAGLARLLSVSRSGLYQWLASGRVPSPVRLGRRALWRAGEIRQWVDAGCPPRARWKPTLN